jgi:hypothetical protein
MKRQLSSKEEQVENCCPVFLNTYTYLCLLVLAAATGVKAAELQGCWTSEETPGG